MRVRLQSSRTASQYHGTIQAAVRTVRYEGITSLFKGLTSPLIANAPLNALVFAGYGQAMRFMETASPSDGISSTRLGIAGAWGGLLQCIVATPSELIKCQQQVYIQGTQKLSTWKVVRDRVKHTGIMRGLFQGWWATVWRDVPSFAIYFVTYEWSKKIMYDIRAILRGNDHETEHSKDTNLASREEVSPEQTASDTDSSQNSTETEPSNPSIEIFSTVSTGEDESSKADDLSSILAEEAEQPRREAAATVAITTDAKPRGALPQLSDTIIMLLAGSISGVFTWGSTYPFDVLKTNVQTKSLSTPVEQLRMSFIARELMKRTGWTSLFRGLSPTLIRAIPTNAVTFLVYEWSLSLLNQ